jgi:hypothetical protein
MMTVHGHRWIAGLAAALALLAPVVAAAQKLNPILHEAHGDTFPPTTPQMRKARILNGMAVIQGGDKIGEIRKVFANQSNKVVAVEIEMVDGVWGEGHVVIVRLAQLRVEKDGAHVRAHPPTPPSPPARQGG